MDIFFSLQCILGRYADGVEDLNDFNSFIENYQCTCDTEIGSTNIAVSKEGKK